MSNNLLSYVDTSLFKFCLQHSDDPNDDGTARPPRDPKDLLWLKEALSSIDDDITRMKKLIAVITDESTSRTHVIQSLEQLLFLIEDIDNANDLHKIGGLVPLINLLAKSTNVEDKIEDEIEDERYWAAWILSTVVQNNPTSQNTAIEHGLLPIVFSILSNSDHQPPKLIEKCLTLLSGLVRDNKQGMDYFQQQNGIDIIGNILSHQNDKVKLKCLYLCKSLMRTDPKMKDQIRENQLLPRILSLVENSNINERSDLREVAFETFLDLTNANTQNLSYCVNSQLPKVIGERIQFLKSLTTTEDQEEAAHELDVLKELDVLLKAPVETPLLH